MLSRAPGGGDPGSKPAAEGGGPQHSRPPAVLPSRPTLGDRLSAPSKAREAAPERRRTLAIRDTAGFIPGGAGCARAPAQDNLRADSGLEVH